MITSLRYFPLSRHCRSSIVTVIPPFNGGGGNWINLSKEAGDKNEPLFRSSELLGYTYYSKCFYEDALIS